MKLIKVCMEDADRIAPLVAAFRIQLKAYKGIKSQLNTESGKEEILEFLNSDFPVFAVEDNDALVGYIVCRIDEPCLWVEHIFVREDHRRKGIASMLFNKAEEIAASMGEDTVYNFVHPNNEKMIRFLRSKGYTVLNMIEIRKPYEGESLPQPFMSKKKLLTIKSPLAGILQGRKSRPLEWTAAEQSKVGRGGDASLPICKTSIGFCPQNPEHGDKTGVTIAVTPVSCPF